MNNETMPMINAEKLKSLAESILLEAERQGATQAAVNLAANKGYTVTAHDGDVETVEYHQDKVLDITVYFGKRSGSASVTDLRPEAVKKAVEAACHIAKFTDEDPDSGLADKEDLAFNYPHLKLDFPWALTVEEAIELAIQCEREAMAVDSRIMSAEASTISTSESLVLYANSHGFIGQFPYTRHEQSCILIAKEGDDMQRDYSYTLASDPKRLLSISEVAKEAALRTVRRLGARKVPTGKTSVIFQAEEARGLIGHFASAISGGNLYRKSSFLLDHLGKKIFPDFMHIQEQPHLPFALSSTPFDNDGVATRANVFIDQGELQSYALGSYSARKLGMKTTGNAGGMHNVIVKNTNQDFNSLLKMMHKGLVITEMMGSGVNMLNGDYSRGVGGFWVENGEIQYPVSEITVGGNLKTMYAGIRAIGNDVDTRGNVHTGSILIDEVTLGGH